MHWLTRVLLQVGDNKNQYVLRFLSHLVNAQVFLGCALTFGLPGHGAGPNDGIAGTANTLSKHILLRSVWHLREVLTPAHIEVRTLAAVLDTHIALGMPEQMVKISSVTNLFAWRLYLQPDGVHFQARQFLGSHIVDANSAVHLGGSGAAAQRTRHKHQREQNEQATRRPATERSDALHEQLQAAHRPADPAAAWDEEVNVWLGPARRASLLLLPRAPVTSFPFFHLAPSPSVKEKMRLFTARPNITEPRDAEFWDSLLREHPQEEHYHWPTPVLKHTAIYANKLALAEVTQALHLTPTQVQHIFPCRIDSFLAAAPHTHKKRLVRLPPAEVKRRGLAASLPHIRAQETRSFKRALTQGDVDEDDDPPRRGRHVRANVVRTNVHSSVSLTWISEWTLPQSRMRSLASQATMTLNWVRTRRRVTVKEWALCRRIHCVGADAISSFLVTMVAKNAA